MVRSIRHYFRERKTQASGSPLRHGIVDSWRTARESESQTQVQRLKLFFRKWWGKYLSQYLTFSSVQVLLTVIGACAYLRSIYFKDIPKQEYFHLMGVVQPWRLRHMNETFSGRDSTWYIWEKSVFWYGRLLRFGNNSKRLSALSNCINCFYKRYYLSTNYSVMGLQSFILFWKATLYKTFVLQKSLLRVYTIISTKRMFILQEQVHLELLLLFFLWHG